MKKEEKRKDLWREIVDIGTAHADEPPQALDLGGHIGRVHAHLHHLRLPPLSSSSVVGAAVLLAFCARRALSSLVCFACGKQSNRGLIWPRGIYRQIKRGRINGAFGTSSFLGTRVKILSNFLILILSS